jgi:uncharacterized membrane protein SpoIIM required for sporulation
MPISPDEFIRARKPDWERLTLLLDRAQGGGWSELSEAELVELGRLYRATTSDLALAQRDFPQHTVAAFLNQVVARAHAFVYRGEPLLWRHLRDFYARGFPQLYREVAPFTIVAALLLFGPALLFYFVTVAFPEVAHYVLSPSQMRLIQSGTPWWKDLNESNQIGAAFLMTHNLQVAFLGFAGGMLLGWFTIYILMVNGVHLGIVMGLLQVYGHAAPLWEFVIGHGVLELSEITMAGGSGWGRPKRRPLTARNANPTMSRYSVAQPTGVVNKKDGVESSSALPVKPK